MNEKYLLMAAKSFKSILLLLIISLFSCNNNEVKTDHADPNSHSVTDYGDFIPGKNDSATIVTNFATINGAIETIGQAGGGTIVLPEGTFFIGPYVVKGDTENNPWRAIAIAYDNITICGAGIGKTILKSNGTFVPESYYHGPNLVGGRGHGIEIFGTKDSDNPRNNIVLKDFELDGQAGWNGDYSLSYKHGSEHGWDMFHKGIIVSNGSYVDNITLENLYVHHYRGEVLYSGGAAVGKLTVRGVKSGNTNASCFNLWGSELLVEDCDFGDEACRFWVEYCARPAHGNLKNQTNVAVFRNNKFHDAKADGSGISITQGDFRPYSITFEGNTIDASDDVFACHGGVKGPLKIVNNEIKTKGTVFHTFAWPGWANSAYNTNVLIENNNITEAGALAEFPVLADSIIIRNNTFNGGFPESKSVEYGAGAVKNILVEGNKFSNCLPPKQNYDWEVHDGFTNEFTRPLFKDNSYSDLIKRERHAFYYFFEAFPKVTPYYEEMEIGAIDADAIPVFETDGYPNGQLLTVTGPKWGRSKLPAGQSSYYVAEDRYINYGKDSLIFKFDASKKKWIEEYREENNF